MLPRTRLALALSTLAATLVACPESDPAPAPVADATSDASIGDATADTVEPPEWADNFGVTESEGDEGCENLDTSHCLFPFPSDRFLDHSGDRPSLQFGVSLPRPAGEDPLGDQHFRPYDGFSVVTPVRLHLADVDLDGSNAPRLTSIDRSLEADSPTVVIDADTGERQAHWTEIDHFSRDGAAPITTIRFPAPLQGARRFIVAIRDMKNTAGSLLEPSAAFRPLRDQTASTWRGMHARRAHYEAEIFPALDTAGVARETLQIAWDFTTQSEADATGLGVAMRDALYAAIGDEGPNYTITSVEELTDHPDIARKITLDVEVPSFVEPMVDNVRRIRRDASGNPVIEGTETVEVVIQIPHSVVASPGTAGVLQYGHGLLYRGVEAEKDFVQQPANRHGFIIVASDMQGMDEDNIATWANVLGTPERFPHLSEEPLQGIMNHLATMRLLKGRFTQETDALATNGGQPFYDPSKLYYYGNSQGGTLGTTIMALSHDVERGVLGVPGCAFEFLLHRSTGFAGFASILSLTYPEADFIALISLISLGFSRIEGVAFAPLIQRETAGLSKRVLLHIAKEDSVVDNKASYLLAHATDSKVLTPAVQPIWGLEEVASPVAAGNVAVEVDFGHPDNPDPYQPAPEEFDTHEDLRRNAIAQDQWWQFLSTNEVVHLCDGVCDPD